MDEAALESSEVGSRTIATVAHNKLDRSNGTSHEIFQEIKVVFDLEGNQRDVIDARDVVVKTSWEWQPLLNGLIRQRVC